MTESLRLEPVVADEWDWQRNAACRGVDSALFFPPDGERGGARRRREQRAKGYCGRCPVLRACGMHALGVHEPYGVWAGMTPAERDAADLARRTTTASKTARAETPRSSRP